MIRAKPELEPVMSQSSCMDLRHTGVRQNILYLRDSYTADSTNASRLSRSLVRIAGELRGSKRIRTPCPQWQIRAKSQLPGSAASRRRSVSVAAPPHPANPLPATMIPGLNHACSARLYAHQCCSYSCLTGGMTTADSSTSSSSSSSSPPSS